MGEIADAAESRSAAGGMGFAQLVGKVKEFIYLLEDHPDQVGPWYRGTQGLPARAIA